MIYPTVGISIFINMIIVALGKVAEFTGIKSKAKIPAKKAGIAKKAVLSLMIAFIIEIVLISVLGSSVFTIHAGLASNTSNISVIEHLIASTHIKPAGTIAVAGK